MPQTQQQRNPAAQSNETWIPSAAQEGAEDEELECAEEKGKSKASDVEREADRAGLDSEREILDELDELDEIDEIDEFEDLEPIDEPDEHA
jgi:hypothetical protein